jgi:hypothetical protein
MVIAAWPAFTAAVAMAAVSLGYTVVNEGLSPLPVGHLFETGERGSDPGIESGGVGAGRFSRDPRIRVMRGNITVTFSRHVQGRASLCVSGPAHSDGELRAIGEELGRRVVQRYVHQRLREEIRARQFVVVEERVDENQVIRLRVRHGEE